MQTQINVSNVPVNPIENEERVSGEDQSKKHPSEELKECLERIGHVTSIYGDLESRVDKMTEQQNFLLDKSQENQLAANSNLQGNKSKVS